MKFCSKCGQPLNDSAMFCPKCGTKTDAIQQQPPQPQPRQPQQPPLYQPQPPQQPINQPYDGQQYGEQQYGGQQYGGQQYGGQQYGGQQYGGQQYGGQQYGGQQYGGQGDDFEYNEKGRFRKVEFIEACKMFWKRYAEFEGRSRRSEYWWAYLMTFLLGCIPGINYISGLACLIPSLAIGARRLHDIGKSGWNLLIGLIPLVGWIILIIWFCQDGQVGPNEYGEDPKYIP